MTETGAKYGWLPLGQSQRERLRKRWKDGVKRNAKKIGLPVKDSGHMNKSYDEND